MLTGKMYAYEGVSVHLTKRPLRELFDPKKFTEGCYRDDNCDRKQREKWEAAFRP